MRRAGTAGEQKGRRAGGRGAGRARQRARDEERKAAGVGGEHRAEAEQSGAWPRGRAGDAGAGMTNAERGGVTDDEGRGRSKTALGTWARARRKSEGGRHGRREGTGAGGGCAERRNGRGSATRAEGAAEKSGATGGRVDGTGRQSGAWSRAQGRTERPGERAQRARTWAVANRPRRGTGGATSGARARRVGGAESRATDEPARAGRRQIGACYWKMAAKFQALLVVRAAPLDTRMAHGPMIKVRSHPYDRWWRPCASCAGTWRR